CIGCTANNAAIMNGVDCIHDVVVVVLVVVVIIVAVDGGDDGVDNDEIDDVLSPDTEKFIMTMFYLLSVKINQ
ncbi:hypothetical protein DERP_003269, partial [Dermatophagoides pteronyssinus]